MLAVCGLLIAVVSLGAYDTKPIGAKHGCSPQPYPPPHATADEFSGPAGAPPNPGLWNHQLGAGGTDGQLEAYTDSPQNASLDGEGHLAIVALNQPVSYPGFGTFNYTSAYLDTHGHLDFCYGTVAARIKLPTGQGIRSAFWLVGSNFPTAGWPQCGEIDVIELPVGGATLHGPPDDYELPSMVPFDVGTDWHEYTLNWKFNQITASVDGNVFASWTPASLPPGAKWVFNGNPMYVILSMAVGGPFGVPDSSTQFPATMLVDWVRYTPATQA